MWKRDRLRLDWRWARHGLVCGVCACLVLPMTAQQQPDAATEDDKPRDPAVAAEGDETDGGQVERSDRQMREIASAYRMRDELASLLTAEGRAAQGGAGANTKLAGLATRCGILSNSAESDAARAVLLACLARANAALAELEGAGSDEARVRRLQQVRAAAEKIRQLDMPGAEASADYWLLLTDLADAAHSEARVDTRQALAEQLMTGYLQQHADNPAGRDYAIDTRLSLAHLLDQRGDQAGVAQQLEAIGDLPDDSPRRAEIDRLTSRAQRIGKPVELEGVTTRLDVWRLSDHLGTPVLVHVYADAVESSVKMIDVMTSAIRAQELGGAVVVSLRVGEPVADAPRAPWPTLPTDLKPDGVLERLGVHALPTLIWIDAQGRVASMGNTRAVLERMPGEEKQVEPEDSDEPGHEQHGESDPPLEGEKPAVDPAGSEAGTDPSEPVVPSAETVEN